MNLPVPKIPDIASLLIEPIGAHFFSGPFLRSPALILLIALFLVHTVAACRAATATIRPDGAILVDGQPTFPFGFCHLSDAKPTGTGDTTRTVDLVQIARSGFDLIQPIIDAPGVNTNRLLNDAYSFGVKTIAQIWWTATNQAYRQTLVSANTSTPAVIGWNVGDDINYPPRSPNYSPDAIKARSSEIHGYAPQHLTCGAFLADPQALTGATYPLGSYAGTVDLAGIEDYPIDGGNAAPAEELEYSASTFRNAREAFRGTATSYIDIPQTFAYSTRWPTNAESRNMLFVSFIYGAHGALCYTFFDGSGSMPTLQPGLWNYFRDTLRQEVAKLRMVLSTGTLSTLTGLPAYLHAATWTLSDQIYVIVANTSRTTPIDATISLPAGTSGPAAPVFPAEPSGLTFSNGELTGTVQPTDVHVYILRRAANPPPGTAPTTAPTE